MLSYLHVILAQAPSPVPGDDLFGWILGSLKWIVEQFQHKNYAPAAGLLIMVLVTIFNRYFKDMVNKHALPWISAGIGVLVSCATNLYALQNGTGTGWLAAIASGLTVGAAASGFWSMVGKWLISNRDVLLAKLKAMLTKQSKE